MRDDINSVLLIDKPAHMSSFGVVARLRRVLSEHAGKKVKVGHTGTLDPFATGLMLIVTGTECKNAGAYSKLDKVYEATIVLGTTSSTGDPEGELIDDGRDIAKKLQQTDIERVLEQFVGDITQTPPIYSAIKIDGERAYKLARQGREVTMPARTVTIYSLELVAYQYPELQIRVHVSSGTYIRTLAEDIGKALGVGAYCSALRRTRVSDYDIDDARTLSDFGISG